MSGWYYEEAQGKQSNEVSEEEILRLIRGKKLLSSTLVWQKGMAQWTALENSPLAQFIHEPVVEVIENHAPPPLPNSTATAQISAPATFSEAGLWHYERADGTAGAPVSETEIHELLKSGKITRYSLVWKQGMNDWIAVEDSELASYAMPEPDHSEADSYAYSNEPAVYEGGGNNKTLKRVIGAVCCLAIIILCGLLLTKANDLHKASEKREESTAMPSTAQSAAPPAQAATPTPGALTAPPASSPLAPPTLAPQQASPLPWSVPTPGKETCTRYENATGQHYTECLKSDGTVHVQPEPVQPKPKPVVKSHPKEPECKDYTTPDGGQSGRACLRSDGKWEFKTRVFNSLNN